MRTVGRYIVYVLCFLFYNASGAGLSHIDSLKLKSDNAPNDSVKVKLLNEIAEYYDNQECVSEEAFKCAEQAIEISRKFHYKTAEAFACINMGKYHQLKGDNENALNEFLKALDIFEKTKNASGLFTAYDKLNSFYRGAMKNYNKALEYSEKELKITEQLNDKSLRETALVNRGNIYYDMNDDEHALKYYLQAVDLCDTLKNTEKKADLENNIGSVYSDMKQYDKAIDYFLKALGKYKELNSKADIAMCYGNLGNIYNMKGEMDKGVEYSEQCLELARQLNAKDIIASSYSFLSEGYSKLGDYKKAFDYQADLLNIKDTIFNEESLKQISDMQVKYDTEKKEKENQILALSVNRQKIISYAVATGLLLVIGLAFFIFRGYRDKQKANVLLEDKNKIIEEKNKDITDSINYAKRIQNAILTSDEYLQKTLGEHFVLYKPKDIVAGDFYWCYSSGDKVVFTVADCTGHGVPGAFMSMIGNSLLNEVVIENKVTDAAKILDKLRADLLKTLQQKGQQSVTRDGMDISLCVWDKTKNEIQFAGANNSLYLVRKDAANGLEMNSKIKRHEADIFEIMADKQPIGFMEDKMDVAFTGYTIKIQKGDILYITSDGYADQFGGASNKKFTKKRFRETLASLNGDSMYDQKDKLENIFEQWKNQYSQTDDICIMGVKFHA